MKKYNNENGRKNMRLQGYDYSRAGMYFLTIVVQKRLHLFGHIENGQMILNDAGQMIEKWYREIENKYYDKRCHQMVVMPNHFHCIIENVEMDAHAHVSGAHVGTPLRGRPIVDGGRPIDDDGRPNPNKYGLHNKKNGATIGDVMDWFKTMTTNEYIRGVKNDNWQRFDGKLWQRNYYDNIIRNGPNFERISNYINKNPENWENDNFNK